MLSAGWTAHAVTLRPEPDSRQSLGGGPGLSAGDGQQLGSQPGNTAGLWGMGCAENSSRGGFASGLSLLGV